MIPREIIDLARENADAIARIGLDAIERARVAGVPVYYHHPEMGVVAHMPDGTLHPVALRVRPENLPDSVMERIQAIADAHPAADVKLVGGLAEDLEP